MASAQGRAAQGLIVGRFSYDLPASARNAKGQFTRFQGSAAQGAIAEANRRAARDLQRSVQAAQKQTLKRRGVSTGQLGRVLGDERNRFASADGYGVGVYDFLDSSRVAAYYRHIEFGTAEGGLGGGEVPNFLGRRLVGVWASSVIRRGGKVQGRPPYTGFGPQQDQKFVPSKRIAKAFKRQAAAEGRRVIISGIIQNPIVAQRFFGRGWEAHDEARGILKQYERELRRRGVPLPGT